MAQVMFGPDDDDPFCLPEAEIDLVAAAGRELGPLRLAYSRNLGVFAVDPEVAAVVDNCVRSLRDSRVDVEEIDFTLPLSQDELAQLWLREVGVLYLDMFASMASSGQNLLHDSPDDFPAPIHAMVEQARAPGHSISSMTMPNERRCGARFNRYFATTTFC